MTHKRITHAHQIQDGATYDIAGIKFTGSVRKIGTVTVHQLEGHDDQESRISYKAIFEIIRAGIPVTEIAPPPVPEHSEPEYEEYGVYRDATGTVVGQWVYLANNRLTHDPDPWLELRQDPRWKSRSDLPDHLRLVRNLFPVEDQS